MRILLTALIIIMFSIMGVAEESQSSERKLDKLEKIDKPQKTFMSLEDEFLANNWEIIVPDFEKSNKAYKTKNGKELGLKAIVINDAKNKIVQIRFQNNFERNTTALTMIVQSHMLYFKTNTGHGMMEIKRNDYGKLICVPMNNGQKMGDVWDMKVFSGSVK